MATKLTKIINELLNSPSPVSTVEICDQYIKDSGCQIVCDKLSSIDTIQTINFRGNDIQQIGAEAIIKLIHHNANINTLKLEWNLLGLNSALSVLCEGLKLSSVRYLDLRNNKIDSNGGKILSEMLIYNQTLNHLDLRWNNLGLIGGEYILQTLQADNENHSLTECLLSGNQIPVQILRSIDVELDKNKKQKLQIKLSPDSLPEPQSNLDKDERIDDVQIDQNGTIETLQQEINELFGDNSKLKEENDEMKLKIAELESENLDFADTQAIAEIKANELEKTISSLTGKYDAERAEMQQKIKELEIKCDEMFKSRHTDKMEFDQIKCSIQNSNDIQINQLRELKDTELNKLRKDVSELHIELNELKSANNTLRSEILENEINSERKCIEFETNLRSECNKNLSDKISDLQENISSIKKSRDDLEFEMKQEKEKYVGLIEQIEADKKQYQQWLNDEQKNKTKLEAEIRTKSMEIQKYTNVITQKNQQIESLKIGLKETQKSIKTLENEHQISMKRVLAQHNRQTLMLEKSLRESEQRLTISEHRKRNMELRIIKIEEEERRKIAAVSEAIKCLTNSFCISTPYGSKYGGCVEDVVEQKESEKVVKVSKKSKEKVVDETIIEIMDDDDDDEVDFMRDHDTFNHRKKKKNKKKSAKSSKNSTK